MINKTKIKNSIQKFLTSRNYIADNHKTQAADKFAVTHLIRDGFYSLQIDAIAQVSPFNFSLDARMLLDNTLSVCGNIKITWGATAEDHSKGLKLMQEVTEAIEQFFAPAPNSIEYNFEEGIFS